VLIVNGLAIYGTQLRKKTKKELEDLLVTLGYPRSEIDPYMLKNDLVDLVEDTLARARV
jgi:hypothetical protein